jgi:Type II site-specific deoxyribonuclease
MDGALFSPDFLLALKAFVDVHHSIYPKVPPQGIYFEALVERAFQAIKKPITFIQAGGANQPRHDLQVDSTRISLKTETGLGTKRELIAITKLCTTEREPWDADTLKRRVVEHLSRYHTILMLRAIWEPETMRYQLVEIPVEMLRLIEGCKPAPVGRRKGRQSLGAPVYREGNVAFRVHFDGSDGKCQVRGLRVADCTLLLEWEKKR